MKANTVKWLLLAAFIFTTATLIAWRGADTTQSPNISETEHSGDTLPPRKRSHSRSSYDSGDFDKAMKELDEAMVDLNKNLRTDIGKEIKLAMDEVKKIDFSKINEEVRTSLKEVDWNQISTEINKAMREAEVEIKGIDMKQIGKEMAEAREEIAAAKIDMHVNTDEIKEEIEKSLKGARTSISKATKELSRLKEFTNELEKDGLISRKKGYKIEIKKGDLYINGTKQSREISDKYRKYYSEDDNYTLRNNGDEISNL